MTQVFVGRMGGSTTSAEGSSALAGWIDVQRPVPSSPATDIASVERGRAIFNAPEVGCAGCHTGPQFTNNATVDVGTGAPFQVPSLVGIAWRAPFMHNGCAAILRDRFGAACGGGDAHGHTSQLLPDQVTDLVNYLESL